MSRGVSIVIPVYNGAAFIAETLDSVRNQSFRPVELHIVNDGSTDTTEEVVQTWKSQHQDIAIQICSLERNEGKSSAVNRGLIQARYDCVMILDADDVLLENALQNELDFLDRNPQCAMVCGLAYQLHASTPTTIIDGGIGCNGDIDDIVAYGGKLINRVNPIISSSVVMRRSVVREIGMFNPNIRFTHDWEYWIRISEKYKIGVLHKPVIYYRMHVGGSSSSNRWGTYHEVSHIIERIIGESQGVWEYVRALYTHARYNAMLAFTDGKMMETGRILLHALGVALRRILRIRL
jgi:glycosyltransferase involved in cell wall biosynthesis